MTDFTGTPDGDTWFGSSGNDTAHGLGGNDILLGYGGDDQLYGGADNDYLIGGAGDDLVDGGEGNDVLALTDSDSSVPNELSAGDQFIGGSGIDTLSLDGGFSTSYDLTAISIAADIEQITNEGNIARLTHAQLNQFSLIQGVFRLVGSGTLNLGGRLGQSTSIYLDNGDDIVTMAGAGSPPGTNFGLHGGGGNDQLTGSEGIDGLEGEAGNDLLEGSGGDDFLVGGEGDDVMRGGAGDDQIFDGAGADVIEGGADDDIVNLDLSGGFSAADQVSGGTGFDRLEITAIFLAPLDFSQFQIADDFEALRAQSGRITISAERLSHFQSFEAAFVKLTTAGNFAISDTLKVADIELSDFGNGFDVSGGGGSTQYRVVGRAGADTVTGSANNDLLTGGGGNDLIHAGQGSDTIGGGTGVDWIDGGGNDDTLRIEEGEAVVAGDRFTGGTGVDTLFIGGPNHGFEVVVADLSAGTIDADIERLEGDTMTGARLSIAQLANFTRVDLQAIHLTNGGAIDFSGKETDGYLYLSDSGTTVTLSDISFVEVVGGAGNDIVSGAADNDAIRGGGGNDVLSGGGGSDILTGGGGHDVLTGGGDNDSYYVDGTDVIAEAAGGGADMLTATSSYVLAAGVEVEAMSMSGDAGAGDLTGNGFAQSISGNESANRLDGAGGIDSLFGYSGHDHLVIDYGDSAEGGAGVDTLVLSLANATGGITLNTGALIGGSYSLLGGGTIVGMEIVESLEGSAFADTLTLAAQTQLLTVDAGDGDDLLSWGTSAVAVNGGAGNDRFIDNVAADTVDGGAGSDTIDYRNAASGVTVTLALLAGQTGSGPGGDQLRNVEHIDGSGHADTLNGSDDSNYLRGMAGSDTLSGKGGNDVLDGGGGVDMLNGDGGDDFFFANGSGDLFDGGSGIDTIDYRQATGPVTVTLALLAGGTGSGPGGDQLRNIENISGSSSGDALNGSDDANFIDGMAGNDTLAGNGGNDRLSGGSGEDRMTGGLGDDQFQVDDSDDQVFEAAGQGDDVLMASISYVLAAGQHVERLVLFGDASAPLGLTGNELANALVGNDAANALNGGGGDDVLQGNGGQDAMAGGAGDDDYYVENAGDSVAELAGEGDDAVYASLSYALAAGQSVELLAATNAGATTAIDLTGNDLANSLAGTMGANRLDGGGGADVMTGHGGNDHYVVDHAGDTVVEGLSQGADTIFASVTYRLAANVHVETLAALVPAATGALNLAGNGIANSLIGNAGANQLDGGGGADAMAGHGGNDTYLVDHAGDTAVEAAGGGIDIVYSSVSYSLNDGSEVESLSTITWEATNAINLTGNNLANTLMGNAGVNQLNGKAGADTMYGREGNDIYFVDNAGDKPIELAGQGSDVVYTSVSYALAANTDVEGLATISFEATNALNLTGNGLANNMIGNDGANQLDGKAGADTMTGRAGNDKYLVDNALDRAFEAAGGGTDAVYTGVSFALTDAQEIEGLSTITWELTTAINLTGNGLKNNIIGNAGANVLDGRGGNDSLQGREGADSYAFTTVLGAGNIDVILGFSSTDDTILLENNGVFVGLAVGALNANAFVIGTAALDASDRILYDQATGRLFFDADGSGAGAAVQFATLQGAPIIAANDFTVI